MMRGPGGKGHAQVVVAREPEESDADTTDADSSITSTSSRSSATVKSWFRPLVKGVKNVVRDKVKDDFKACVTFIDVDWRVLVKDLVAGMG